MLLRLLIYVVIAYLLLALLIFLMQRRLLYLPDTRILDAQALQGSSLQLWPQSGNYRALVNASARTYPNGTIIVFHGNAGRALDRAYYIHALEPLGYRVLLAEYPAYGGREGKLSEASLVADAQATVALTHKEFGGPIFLWGESLGAGVVSGVIAGNKTPIAGAVLLTPFDSLSELAQALYWFIPARRLVLDKFDNVKNLQSFAQPVAVVLSERDEVVPEHHGMRLYESLRGEKMLKIFTGAGHNNWPNAAGESWWREVMDFISEK